MHGSQRGIAILHAFRDDAQRDEIVDFREALPLPQHLLINGIQVLRATHYLALHAHRFHFLFQDCAHAVDIRLALLATCRHHAADLLELCRLEVEER